MAVPIGYVWTTEQWREPARLLYPVGDPLLRAGDPLYLEHSGLAHRQGAALVGHAAHDPLPTIEDANRYADETWGALAPAASSDEP